MKRFIWSLLVALAIAAPASAQSIGQDLVTERAKYGALMSRAEIGAMLNAVTFKHKDEGFGLLSKSGGNNCPQPSTGKAVSCDWIVNIKTHRGGDSLGSATNDDGSPAPATPGFNQSDTYDGSNFVEPVKPEGGPPPPPPPPGDAVTHDELRAAITELHTTHWKDVGSVNGDMRGVIDRNFAALDARLKKLEATGTGGSGGGTPADGDTLAVLREQLATSKQILELLKKTAGRFGVQ